MARLDVQCSNGLQHNSQSKHPFLNRSSNMSSSQSQPSIPHGSLTQLSQNASRFSQSSQPEDFGDQVMTSHLTQVYDLNYNRISSLLSLVLLSIDYMKMN